MPEESHRDLASVLVVDDDRAISKLIKFNLENESTKVINVATGSDGIRVLHEAKIDLLLLDLGLPDIDGRAVLSELRETYLLRNLPVIVVSAEPPDRHLMERFSLDDYIQKPFDMRDLLLKVKKAITTRNPIPCPA